MHRVVNFYNQIHIQIHHIINHNNYPNIQYNINIVYLIFKDNKYHHNHNINNHNHHYKEHKQLRK